MHKVQKKPESNLTSCELTSINKTFRVTDLRYETPAI